MNTTPDEALKIIASWQKEPRISLKQRNNIKKAKAKYYQKNKDIINAKKRVKREGRE